MSKTKSKNTTKTRERKPTRPGLSLVTCHLSLLLVVAFFCASRAGAAQPDEQGSTYSVVICGIGGDAEYEKVIQGWGQDLNSALRKNGVADDHVFWLAAKKVEGV